jgi:hypothetical protein
MMASMPIPEVSGDRLLIIAFTEPLDVAVVAIVQRTLFTTPKRFSLPSMMVSNPKAGLEKCSV